VAGRTQVLVRNCDADHIDRWRRAP